MCLLLYNYRHSLLFNMIRYVKIFAGCICLFLGIIGIVVPLLPTTPFLLLSSYLFFKSSPRLQHYLLNHKYVGTYIKNYQITKAIPLKLKIFTISFLWITILISVIIFSDLLWLCILLISIAIAVTIHLLSFKTLR